MWGISYNKSNTTTYYCNLLFLSYSGFIFIFIGNYIELGCDMGVGHTAVLQSQVTQVQVQF